MSIVVLIKLLCISCKEMKIDAKTFRVIDFSQFSDLAFNKCSPHSVNGTQLYCIDALLLVSCLCVFSGCTTHGLIQGHRMCHFLLHWILEVIYSGCRVTALSVLLYRLRIMMHWYFDLDCFKCSLKFSALLWMFVVLI